MKWPWASLAQCDQWAAVYIAEVNHLRNEVRRLTDIIVELRREGFQPPARPSDLQPVEDDLPDEVKLAIAGRAQGLPEVERELVRYAHSMKGTEPATIADRIWRGSDPEEDE